jgi:hypothetical protein
VLGPGSTGDGIEPRVPRERNCFVQNLRSFFGKGASQGAVSVSVPM